MAELSAAFVKGLLLGADSPLNDPLSLHSDPERRAHLAGLSMRETKCPSVPTSTRS